MLDIEVENVVTCTCHLTDEDEQKIINWINKKKLEDDMYEYLSEDKQITNAVYCLYMNGEIDLYKDYTESDSSTEEIRWSEFEERSAKEILCNK